MSDYVEQLDRTIQSVGEEVLEGAGKVSHKRAMEKAEGEYRKYQVKTLSSVEKAYIETLKELKQIESNSKRQGLQGRRSRCRQAMKCKSTEPRKARPRVSGGTPGDNF